MASTYIVSLLCLLSAVDSLTALAAEDLSLSKAQQQFTTELFQQIAADSSYAKDVFFSPYSVYRAMLTVYVASANNTEKDMENFLRFNQSSKPDKNYITKKFFHKVSETTAKQYKLTAVDRIYISPDYKVKSDKKNLFDDKVAVFKSKTDREEEINNWVSKNTEGLIKQVVEKGSINKGTAIVFVNAAYFKGCWTIPLTDGTGHRPFTLSDGTIKETLFMSKKNNPYQSMRDEELKAQIISLPYKGDDISMIVILPTTKPQKGSFPPIADVVRKLTSAKFQKIESTLENQPFCATDLLIPKFKSGGIYELKKVFEALGDKQLFTEKLDLTNLFEPGKPVYVDSIAHQAKVNVYENGTEAAAATAVISHTGPMPLPPRCPPFHADHPFIYIIYDRTNRFINFIGILNTPKQN